MTIHQWQDWARGLRELRRVSRGPVVILTFDAEALPGWWLAGQSAWQFADREAVSAGLDRLAADLASRDWDARYGHLRTKPDFVGAVRLVVATG